MKKKIVTIDGPAGAGKTTVSKALARRLGWIYVDTGALYRGVALGVKRAAVNWEDDRLLAPFLDTLDMGFSTVAGEPVLVCAGEDVSGLIRTPEISMLASAVSARPLVRKALLNIQYGIAQSNDAVFEGRDMGTVVFPHADHKFFLFADLNTRALRRFNEDQAGENDIATVKEMMARRDGRDSSRATAPLKPAPDAVMLDSTGMTPDDVVNRILSYIN